MLPAHPALRDPGKRPLQHILQPRDHHRDADQGEHDQASPADEILRQRQRAQHQGPEQREHAETQREPGDHEVRPPAVGGPGRPGPRGLLGRGLLARGPLGGGWLRRAGWLRRGGTAVIDGRIAGNDGGLDDFPLPVRQFRGGHDVVPGSLRTAGQEDHRQHRQDAGRYARDEPADEPDQDKRYQADLRGWPLPTSGAGAGWPGPRGTIRAVQLLAINSIANSRPARRGVRPRNASVDG